MACPIHDKTPFGLKNEQKLIYIFLISEQNI